MNNSLSPIGTLFRESWRRYKTSFSASTKIAFILAIVTQAFPLGSLSVIKGNGTLAAIYSLVALIITIWFGTLLAIAIYRAVQDEGRTEWQLYYDQAQPAWGRYIRTKILQAILTVAGLLFFIIPGLIALARFAVADFTSIFEGLSARESLRRSAQYVKGRTFSVLARVAVFIIVVVVAQLIIVFALEIVLGESKFWGGIFANLIIVTFLGPWSAAYMNELYNDLRKTEGEVVPSSFEAANKPA